MTEVTTRGSIPSQAVNRRPLPERDFITLCELVTWRAIGKARSAAVLRRFVRRFIRRHKGQPWLTELRRVIENEAAHLLSLLRSREIEAFGHVDHGARRKIPREYLVNDVFAEPQSDTIAPDYSVRFDSDDVPTYRSVCFLRTDVQRTFGIAGNRTAVDAATARDDQQQAAELPEPAQDENRPPDSKQISFVGRPSKMKAIIREMRRRAKEDVLCPTLAAEARALCQWAEEKFPDDQIPKEPSMKNAIRSEYRKLRPTPI